MAINNSYAQKKITPVITWLTPESISYGTSLSNTQLNATSNVSGTFSYNPSAGTILNAGTQKLSTTFTPTNKSLYNSTTASVNILVNPAPAIITISNTTQTYDGNPKTVTVTTSPLNIATTVTYTGTSGTSYSTSTTAPTNAGTYSVVAKLNNGNYIAAEASATLLINPGTNTKIDPVISWANPSDIQYGTALGKKQLNATANVSGTFVYTPPSGAVLSAGSQTLSTTFTPTNTSQYNSATQNVTLIVKKATASVTLSNLSQTYSGTPKSANVTTNPAGLSYSITYDSNSGAPTNAGSYSVSVIVNDPNYAGASTATLVINKATPRITITTGGSYTYDGT
ncbi:MAG TPA: MBG domain-containing protein, partial [Chitinophagaceae bacterium]|nr:MBG domain-containing protein [Chitinophagaceae bacterium]